jgi:hypothetical protein
MGSDLNSVPTYSLSQGDTMLTHGDFFAPVKVPIDDGLQPPVQG